MPKITPVGVSGYTLTLNGRTYQLGQVAVNAIDMLDQVGRSAKALAAQATAVCELATAAEPGVARANADPINTPQMQLDFEAIASAQAALRAAHAQVTGTIDAALKAMRDAVRESLREGESE
jgi:hypothetical protein